VKITVTDGAVLTYDDCPGGTSRPVVTHQDRTFGLTPTLTDGYGELVFLTRSLGRSSRVRGEALERGLHGEKDDIRVAFESLLQGEQRRESVLVAAGAPGLETVEIHDLPLEV